MKRVMCIVGTRPEIIKMQPVISFLMRNGETHVTLVHSGQHYDAEMSGFFLDQLDYPRPDLNLRVGSGTHAEQTARMIVGYERAIRECHPDLVLAQGDTNTVVAAGLAAIKLKVSFGHVESGLRCFDRTMSEEINRTIADQCAQLCFAPTNVSASNLMREGIAPNRIFVTGNTIVEACKRNLSLAQKHSEILGKLGLEDEQKIILVTAHREENVDNPTRLKRIVRAIRELKDFFVIYPIHPRTRKMLRIFNLAKSLRMEHIIATKPLGYWDFLRLLEMSRVVLTDSGGVQEEALTVGVPCLTLRHNTERPETIQVGANRLVGTEVPIITRLIKTLAEDTELRRRLRSMRNPLGDGKAGERIANICRTGNTAIESVSFMKAGAASFRLIRLSRAQRVDRLEREHRMTVMVAYDPTGTLILPSKDLELGKGWHIQVFGEEVLSRAY